MEEYKTYLQSLSRKELQDIARAYMAHVEFKYTEIKKNDIIDHLLKHTERVNDVIKIKEYIINTDDIIKGVPISQIKKKLEKDNLSESEKKRIRKLLTLSGFDGKINLYETERDDLLNIDKDNLRKKYTKEITELNKKILDTKNIRKEAVKLLKILKDKHNVITRQTPKEPPKNINNILDNIEKQYNLKNDFFFVGGELVAEESGFKEIKQYVKDNFEPPKKDIKGYVVRMKINKDDDKNILHVSCMQVTISPKLFIKSTDNDGIQLFTFTKDELLKYGFSMDILKIIMDAIKYDKVSYRKTSVPISDIM